MGLLDFFKNKNQVNKQSGDTKISISKKGRLIGKFDKNIEDIKISPNNKYAVTCFTFDPDIVILDIEKCQEINKFTLNNKYSQYIAISPDSQFVASTVENNIVKIWNIEDGKEIQTLIHNDIVQDFVFSPDGNNLATASDDKILRIWDIKGGKALKEFEHWNEVSTLAYNPTGQYIASNDKTRSWDPASKLRVWNIGTEKEMNEGHHVILVFSISSIAFSHDGKYIATGGQATRVIDKLSDQLVVWDINNPNRLSDFEIKEEWKAVKKVEFTPDGKHLLCQYYWGKNKMGLWNLSNNQEKLIAFDDEIEGFAIRRDFSSIILALKGKEIREYQIIENA